jgi:hypothetical protein
MANDRKAALYPGCRLLLRPIVLLLLKCGMTWKEFSDLSKRVFVEVATDEFGIRGRPTNVSRVSILTGISRKEVSHQRKRLAEVAPPQGAKTNDATRLLSGWFQDPDFCNPSGVPLPLPERGKAPSFESLFERYGGDTPFQTLLKELKSAASIAVDGAGRLTASRRYHMPAAMSDENIRVFGANLFDHARTLERNVAGREGQKSFEGNATDDRIRASDAGEFRSFVNERSQRFLEEIDAWLHRHRITGKDNDTRTARLGVGIYAIEGHLQEGPRS